MPLVTANSCSFNGVDITSIPGLTILAINPYIPAKRKLTLNDIARTNKAKLNSAFYNARSQTVRVALSRASRALVENSLDSLMAILQGIDKDLVLNQSGGLRKYAATFADAVFKVEGGSYLEFDLVFETSDHYGYDQADTLLKQVSGFTSGQKTDPITVGGSAAWQVPVITLTLTSVTSGTSKYIQFGNDATGQTVVITRTWAAGDVLEIDALNQTVKVNGVEVAFTGAIPEWAPGVGYVSYSDNFSARTVSYNIKHKQRWV